MTAVYTWDNLKLTAYKVANKLSKIAIVTYYPRNFFWSEIDVLYVCYARGTVMGTLKHIGTSQIILHKMVNKALSYKIENSIFKIRMKSYRHPDKRIHNILILNLPS